ncbi:MAG: hypothetical protein LUQ47_05645 [Methanotrichaceae archaeon]|nr:hypothetical protein [Methanotrichaceae archaeon]
MEEWISVPMSIIDSIQVAYPVAFAAMHSLLSSKQFKELIWRIFGPEMDRWYMKFFIILAAITFIPLAIMLVLFPGRKFV